MMVEGKIEAISHTKFGIKFEDKDYWLNTGKPAVQKAFEGLKAGDTVEYAEGEKRELTFVKKLATAPLKQNGDKEDYGLVMEECVKQVNALTGLISDPKIREGMNWAAVINTLFMARTGRGSNGRGL